MPLCCNGTSWKLYCKAFLKLSHMVLYIPIHGCSMHKLLRINFSQSFNINWSSLFVHTMIAMRIILQNFIQLFKFKILHNCISTKFLPPLKHISPHVLCFFNFELSCFQKPGRQRISQICHYLPPQHQ
uniref:Phosphatidylinositol/phosphatidylcholine transfer protein SFH8 isoform X2 n=1 Tax=Rhizophora mucronata TaxID=61149 RepID=A0A2P2MCQ2_RHIMU